MLLLSLQQISSSSLLVLLLLLLMSSDFLLVRSLSVLLLFLLLLSANSSASERNDPIWILKMLTPFRVIDANLCNGRSESDPFETQTRFYFGKKFDAGVEKFVETNFFGQTWQTG